LGRRRYVRVPIKPQTYLLLKEVKDLAIRLNRGRRLPSGAMITEDMIIRDALDLLKSQLESDLREVEGGGGE